MGTQLSVFDLVPVVSGKDATTAVQSSLDLATKVEEFGYHRLWYGEHHLNPGVIGYSPALLIGLAATATQNIRIGSGAVLAGHRTPLSVAEEFSMLEALAPGRVDLGLGRAGLRSAAEVVNAPAESEDLTRDRYTDNGLLLPAAPDLTPLYGSARFAAQRALLNAEGAQPPTYAEFLDQIADFFNQSAVVNGLEVDVISDTVSAPQTWVLGSSPGESSELAATRGLRFGANYHVQPSHVVAAVEHYRENFQPSADLEKPWVIVSAEVLVADTEAQAQHLAAGYAQWVHSIRSGSGAIPYPTPEEANNAPLTDQQHTLVADRTATRFVGTADQVVEQLEVLRQATGADELLISTITHDHAARLRSFELLSQAWEAHEEVSPA